MKNKIDIIGVASILDPKMTKWMHATDYFQAYKVVAVLIEVHYQLEYEGEDKTIDELRNLFQYGLDMAKKEFVEKLVFCHIQKVSQNDISVENKSVVPVFNPDVSVVYDGEKNTEALVVKILEYFCPGIKIEEGEIRKIKSLTWPQVNQK